MTVCTHVAVATISVLTDVPSKFNTWRTHWLTRVLIDQMAEVERFGRTRLPTKLQQRLENVQAVVAEEEDSAQLGPKSNVSLLDQHSRLKLEAEGESY